MNRIHAYRWLETEVKKLTDRDGMAKVLSIDNNRRSIYKFIFNLDLHTVSRLSCGCTIRKVPGELRKLPINFRTRRFLALRSPLSLLIRSLYSLQSIDSFPEEPTGRRFAQLTLRVYDAHKIRFVPLIDWNCARGVLLLATGRCPSKVYFFFHFLD